MPPATLTGAIIGAGRVVQDYHVAAWQSLGRDAVAHWTLADPSYESRVAVQMALGIPAPHAYRDHRALLLREKPDFAVVSSPHLAHEPIVMDCLRAGLPVLVEKPMAATLASAERMVREAERANLPLAVIHNYRSRPQAALARRLLAEGAIGRPFLFRCEALGIGWHPGASGTDRDWRAKLSLSGGGCLLDNGYHAIYMARDFLGPIASVFARVETYTHAIDVDDTAMLLLGHADGGSTSVQAAWSAAGDAVAVNELYGTGGTMRLEADGVVAISRAGHDWERHPAPPDPGFVAVFRNFLETLHGHGVPLTTGKDALENLRVVRAAYASAERGMAVDVPAFNEP